MEKIPSDIISFKIIILEHLRRCITLGSKEFTGGYWQTKTHIVGSSQIQDHFYVRDSREEYSNAVSALADVLLPHFDKEMTKAEEEHEKGINKHGEEPDDKEKQSKHRMKRAMLKRKLFRELNKFLKRVNYFDMEDMVDTDDED